MVKSIPHDHPHQMELVKYEQSIKAYRAKPGKGGISLQSIGTSIKEALENIWHELNLMIRPKYKLQAMLNRADYTKFHHLFQKTGNDFLQKKVEAKDLLADFGKIKTLCNELLPKVSEPKLKKDLDSLVTKIQLLEKAFKKDTHRLEDAQDRSMAAKMVKPSKEQVRENFLLLKDGSEETGKKGKKASPVQEKRSVTPYKNPRQARIEAGEALAQAQTVRKGKGDVKKVKVPEGLEDKLIMGKEIMKASKASLKAKAASDLTELQVKSDARKKAKAEKAEALAKKELEAAKAASQRAAVHEFKDFFTDGVMKLKRSDGKTVADFFNQYGMKGRFSRGGVTQQDLAGIAKKKNPTQDDVNEALKIVNAALTRPYRDVLGRGKDIAIDPKVKDTLAAFINRMKDLG